MGWLEGLSKNWADLDPADPDPVLRPVIVPLAPSEAAARAAEVIAALPRWGVDRSDPAGPTLHATRRTLVWRFVDDVTIRFEPAPDGGTAIGAHSRSRVGKGDFGQNRRNLRALTRALRRSIDQAR